LAIDSLKLEIPAAAWGGEGACRFVCPERWMWLDFPAGRDEKNDQEGYAKVGQRLGVWREARQLPSPQLLRLRYSFRSTLRSRKSLFCWYFLRAPQPPPPPPPQPTHATSFSTSSGWPGLRYSAAPAEAPRSACLAGAGGVPEYLSPGHPMRGKSIERPGWHRRARLRHPRALDLLRQEVNTTPSSKMARPINDSMGL